MYITHGLQPRPIGQCDCLLIIHDACTDGLHDHLNTHRMSGLSFRIQVRSGDQCLFGDSVTEVK